MDWKFVTKTAKPNHRGAQKDFAVAWQQGWDDGNSVMDVDRESAERDAQKKLKDLKRRLNDHFIPSLKGSSSGDYIKWCASVMAEIAYESGRINALIW